MIEAAASIPPLDKILYVDLECLQKQEKCSLVGKIIYISNNNKIHSILIENDVVLEYINKRSLEYEDHPSYLLDNQKKWLIKIKPDIEPLYNSLIKKNLRLFQNILLSKVRGGLSEYCKQDVEKGRLIIDVENKIVYASLDTNDCNIIYEVIDRVSHSLIEEKLYLSVPKWLFK